MWYTDGVHVVLCDRSVLLEQFIRAKYEREEFIEPSRQGGYMASTKSGHLFKRGRDAAKFEIRRFELSEATNKLAYYVKEVRTQLHSTSPSNAPCAYATTQDCMTSGAGAYRDPMRSCDRKFIREANDAHTFGRSVESCLICRQSAVCFRWLPLGGAGNMRAQCVIRCQVLLENGLSN